MHRSLCPCLLLLATWSMHAQADMSWEAQVDSSSAAANTGSLFSVPELYRQVAEESRLQEILLGYQHGGLRVQLSALAQQTDLDGDTQAQVQLQELVYDFSAGAYEWSVGKKVVAWGVGYGFRPLDLVQQQARLPWQALSVEGVPLLSMESFTAESADSWVVYQQARTEIIGSPGLASALAYQHYLQSGYRDLYSVAELNEVGTYKLGAGLSQVVGEGLEWHGSLLFMSDYEKSLRDDTLSLIASSEPFITQRYKGGVQALLGTSWSWHSGVTTLLEAWYDATAYTRDEWRALFQLTSLQRAELGGVIPEAAIYNNILWNSRALLRSSLMQQNLLWQIRYAGERLEPEGFLLWAPEDGGYMANLGVTAKLGEHTRITAAWRRFGGPLDSVYAQLPMQELWSVGFRMNGLW